MGYLTALFAVFVRLLRPSGGLHSDPCGYFRAVTAEVRRRRSTRVRRYAPTVPALAENEDHGTEPAPSIPHPRRPLDTNGLPRVLRDVPAAYVPVVDPVVVVPQAALVRGYYVAHERREALRRADRDRLGLAVLIDVADAAKNMEMTA